MKQFILAAIATLSLGIGAAYAAQQPSAQAERAWQNSLPAYSVGGDGA
jgi:hypothetical protein